MAGYTKGLPSQRVMFPEGKQIEVSPQRQLATQALESYRQSQAQEDSGYAPQLRIPARMPQGEFNVKAPEARKVSPPVKAKPKYDKLEAALAKVRSEGPARTEQGDLPKISDVAGYTEAMAPQYATAAQIPELRDNSPRLSAKGSDIAPSYFPRHLYNTQTGDKEDFNYSVSKAQADRRLSHEENMSGYLEGMSGDEKMRFMENLNAQREQYRQAQIAESRRERAPLAELLPMGPPVVQEASAYQATPKKEGEG